MSRIFCVVAIVLTPVSNLSFSQTPIEWRVSPLAVDCDGPSDNQGFSWFKNEFNNSLWQNVLLPHGIGQNTSADRFYRGKFTLNEIPESLELFVSSDDGLWIYVNGNFVDHWGGECHEIGCVNEPLCGGSNTDIGSIDISSYLQTGTNIIAAHVSNCSCQGGMSFNAVLLNDILPVRLPGGNYYQLVLKPRLSWQTAYESAQSARYLDLLGHLATITSREEDLFLESLRQNLLLNRSPDAYEFWIGGFQSSDETTPQDGWQWINNEGPIQGFNNGIQYSNWFNGEPNDYGRTPNIEDNEENHLAVGFFGFGWNDNDQYLRSIFGYIIEYEISQENQPPEITHTPITSALQGKEILFSMQVTDDQNQLKTLVIFARVAGERDFTPYPIGVSPGQTMYDKGISGLTDTLAGVEYYIEATDKQGLVGYHRSDDGAHFICVTDPDKKTPVIIIPGIPGTELWDMERNEKIWINLEKATDPLHPQDLFLLRLLLQKDGITPDRRGRCSNDLQWRCDNLLDCPQFPLPSTCVDGGSNQITVKNVVNIAFFFTAYKDLVKSLETHGYVFGKDLFLFGYDWRLSLGYYESLDKSPLPEALRSIIEGMTPRCEDKVHIIAHSLGGLLFRSYLKWCEEKELENRIDTAIYLGTPHGGAPKAYGVLRWAHAFLRSFPIYGINRHTLSFISQNFPSVYQLLPQSEFFVKQDETFENLGITLGKLSNQGLVTRANEFHQSIQGINPVQRSFAINGSGQYTPWIYRTNKKGDVEVFPDLLGDGTVPTSSSSEFIGTQDLYVNGKHDDLPGIPAVQEKILKILKGKENDMVSGIQSRPFMAPELYKWKTLSPVTVRFTDSEGNFTGRDENDDIVEEIPESQFFVFEHNEAGFLPRDGEYTVEIQALDTGRFTLQFDTMNADGEVLETLAYEGIPISNNGKGELFLSPNIPFPDLLLDVDGDGIPDFTLLPGENPPEELKNMFVENGDVNKDKKLDISDAIAILGYLFLGNEIACVNASDTNSDTKSDVSDSIYLLGYLFLGTAEKPQGIIFCP